MQLATEGTYTYLQSTIRTQGIHIFAHKDLLVSVKVSTDMFVVLLRWLVCEMKYLFWME